MNEAKQPLIIRSRTDLWKTIDDVNATFDSLSLINRGKPTIKPGKPRITQTESSPNKSVNRITGPQSADIDNVGIIDDSRKEDKSVVSEDPAVNGFTMGVGRGKFIKELNKHCLPAVKDKILQTELSKLFPYSFSNEDIEKYWTPVEKAEQGQFDENDDALIERNDVVSSTEFFKEYENEDVFKETHESSSLVAARAASPPMFRVHSPGKSTSPDVHDDHQEIVSNNSLNSLEIISEDFYEDIRPTSTGKTIIEEKVLVARPKKCRNALLNSLNKKESLEKQIEGPVVLKTPSDFLVSGTEDSSNNNNDDEIRQETSTNFLFKGTSSSYSCIVKQKAKNKFKGHASNDSFELCEEDFPAL